MRATIPPHSAALMAPITATADLPAVVEHDRQVGIERVIELTRWIILIIVAIGNNFSGNANGLVTNVNLLLGVWALFNLSATVSLKSHHLPERYTPFVVLILDIVVASALVGFTGGASSSLGIAFYVAIIASSLRYRLSGALLSTTLTSVMYLEIALLASGRTAGDIGGLLAPRLFLFYVIAFAAALIVHEVTTARARQMEQAYALEHAAADELREIDRIKREFTLLASHELRTPLTKIKAWLTILQDAGDRIPESTRNEDIKELSVESEHMGRLIDNLLCIAQLEADQIHIETSSVTIEALLHHVQESFVDENDYRRISCHIAVGVSHVIADSERLELVLACLVDNALKFSPVDKPVTLTVHSVGEDVHIEVRDEGPRIPDTQVEQMFTSFHQLESPLNRHHGGFGIGLYLSRQLTIRMGGEIWLDQTSHDGNTFVVALPGS